MKKPVVSLETRWTDETLSIGNRPENRNGDIGIITMLDVKSIKVAKYQKELNLNRVRDIIKNFDINRMRPIDVSYRDNDYWVFDGQHRANAYLQLGYTTIPSIIHYGLTYEQEAYLFARQQEQVGSINSNHKWNALVEANDPDTMKIVMLCKDWGFTVLAKNNKGNNIKCVKTLRDLYNKLGPTKVGTILMSIRDAWGYMDHSTDYPIVGGIARLVETYPDFDYNRLRKALSNTTPRIILRDMEDKHHAVRGETRRAAYQILDLYNYNLKNKSFRLNAMELE